jgi:hypothetical protein
LSITGLADNGDVLSIRVDIQQQLSHFGNNDIGLYYWRNTPDMHLQRFFAG